VREALTHREAAQLQWSLVCGLLECREEKAFLCNCRRKLTVAANPYKQRPFHPLPFTVFPCTRHNRAPIVYKPWALSFCFIPGASPLFFSPSPASRHLATPHATHNPAVRRYKCPSPSPGNHHLLSIPLSRARRRPSLSTTIIIIVIINE
jgi:hypothetical protein